jgi:hypothetical protein
LGRRKLKQALGTKKMRRAAAFLLAGLALQFVARPDEAQAAEGGLGFYLLGSKTSLAGFVPPPGTYVADFNYFYTGSTPINFNIGGVNVNGGVDADAYIKLFTGLWTAPEKVLGGNVAFGVTVPIGWKNVSAGATVDAFGHALQLNFQDDGAHVGDPVLGASLGWHEGSLHWSLNTLLNIPVGYWKQGDVTNIGFNRWAGDVLGAVTYLDMKTGLELSGAAGFTFNGSNQDTDYKTGTEFHFEGAAMQHFSKTLSAGIQGYFYQQVTGDSGPSTKFLGDFKGRVVALGPAADFSFVLGTVPVSGSVKYFHEFDVENRLQGDAGYLNFMIPLSGGGH